MECFSKLMMNMTICGYSIKYVDLRVKIHQSKQQKPKQVV